MPLGYFSPLIIVVALASTPAGAAEWPQCEQAKLRQLQLERRPASSKKTGKKPRRAVSNRRSVADLDEWLWKNCRQFAAELRTLEQSRM